MSGVNLANKGMQHQVAVATVTGPDWS